MKPLLILFSLVVMASNTALSDVPNVVAIDSQKVVLDPKTKVLFYLESDLRHIAALSPDGKLLWCCELIPKSAPRLARVVFFYLDATDDRVIDVESPASST